MKLTKKRNEEGVEIRLSLFIDNETLEQIPQIQAEDYDLLEAVRKKDGVDMCLMNLRLLMYWANMVEHQSKFKRAITDGVQRRKQRGHKGGKKRRVRRNR